MSVGRSGGAVSVLNAIPCGIGATIGIDLCTEAVFSVVGDTHEVVMESDPSGDARMAEVCVGKAYETAGLEEPEGWRLVTRSDIPPSRGLKSSSSACNAILEAVFSEIGFTIEPVDMIRLGTACAREAGVTVTGAFDDACGCGLGGLVMTDNTRDLVIARSPIGEYDAVLHIPDGTVTKDSVPVGAMRAMATDARMIAGIAMRDPFSAMTMNGRMVADALGLDNGIAERAMELGALGAGITGTGPATAVMVPSGTGASMAEALGLDPGHTVIARTRD